MASHNGRRVAKRLSQIARCELSPRLGVGADAEDDRLERLCRLQGFEPAIPRQCRVGQDDVIVRIVGKGAPGLARAGVLRAVEIDETAGRAPAVPLAAGQERLRDVRPRLERCLLYTSPSPRD